MAWFRLGEKIRFRFFFGRCTKFLSLKKDLSFFSPFFPVLDVHLYRKSLHILFKEILQ
jgi:hypothetical protein